MGEEINERLKEKLCDFFLRELHLCVRVRVCVTYKCVARE